MLRKMSDSVSMIANALVHACAELEDVKRGGSATIPTKAGGSYSYKYATLPDVLQQARPVLRRHGLAIIQNASEGGDGSVVISTMLVHESGEFMAFEGLPMPMGSTAQETGSAITYGRRYQVLAVLGLAADDDDDGATANPRSAPSTEGGVVRQLTGQASEKQIGYIKGACKRAGVIAPRWLDQMSKADASAFIEAEKNGEPVAQIIDRMRGEEPF